MVLEDTSELTFPGRHVVRLEARPPSADSVRAVTLAELVRTALRLRPDRLVVGEFRGDEVVSVIQALNTGHDGSLSTCHANSALDGLHRVETLVMQAAPNWPLPAIRQQISRSIDVIVHVERVGDGARRVVEVVEPVVTSGDPSVRSHRRQWRNRRQVPTVSPMTLSPFETFAPFTPLITFAMVVAIGAALQPAAPPRAPFTGTNNPANSAESAAPKHRLQSARPGRRLLTVATVRSLARRHPPLSRRDSRGHVVR